jgi:lipopolysaccharide heptosyltransferase III
MSAELAAPASILFINVSRIGDTLLATPALRAIANAWPKARISFLGHPKRAEIIRQLPFVAEVGAITKHRAWWRGRLGGKRWDLALVLGFDAQLVAYAERVADNVVAFRQDDVYYNDRLFRCVERPGFQSIHSALAPLLLTQSIGVPDAGHRLAYVVTQQEQEWARAMLGRAVPVGARPVIGLQVASFPTKAYRDWPVEHFAALCARIVGRWPRAHFVLFGGKVERPRIEELARPLGARASSFAGRLTLRQSAALMSRLDLYIGVDTGPTHIMGALEAPMIALYHCYSPSRLLAPLERPACYVVDHPRVREYCTPETPMAEIAVDTVWEKVLEALAPRAGA